ncbi:unnamed protein product [Malus baccata var. baccata]
MDGRAISCTWRDLETVVVKARCLSRRDNGKNGTFICHQKGQDIEGSFRPVEAAISMDHKEEASSRSKGIDQCSLWRNCVIDLRIHQRRDIRKFMELMREFVWHIGISISDNILRLPIESGSTPEKFVILRSRIRREPFFGNSERSRTVNFIKCEIPIGICPQKPLRDRWNLRVVISVISKFEALKMLKIEETAGVVNPFAHDVSI